jgi:hypothetical protein
MCVKSVCRNSFMFTTLPPDAVTLKNVECGGVMHIACCEEETIYLDLVAVRRIQHIHSLILLFQF